MADPISQNIEGVRQLVNSKLNKVDSGAADMPEGVIGEKEDKLSLKLDDSRLIKLSDDVTNRYASYEGKIKVRQQDALKYYEGLQREGTPLSTNEKPIAANLIFQSVETFLAAALSRNPEPVVYSDNTPQGNELSTTVKTMLQFHAEVLVMRRKLKLLTRKWMVDLLGVLKVGWDSKIGDVSLEVEDAKRFVFDPDGYIDAHGDFIGILGHRVNVTAERLTELFPKHKNLITLMVDAKMGTEVVYTEWWDDDITFVTFKGKILDKARNPNFNYDTTSETEEVDEEGHKIKAEVKGMNHFAVQKKPFIFLSVFSFGDHPHDDTGLIEQNIPNQRLITRRTEQIDFNLSKANNSDVFSQDNFTQETAKSAATGMAKGNPLLIPSGRPISEAIARLPAPTVPTAFFNDLEVNKQNLLDNFGVTGITATQQDEDQTARGMILNQQYDNSRIGGGIGEALEQVAKNVFNYLTQMYYVYYDERHFAAVMGQMKAVEYVTLTSQNLMESQTDQGIPRKVIVTVSPDSMRPKDEVSQINQAISFFEAGLIGPKTVLTLADFPNPDESAADGIVYKLNPMAYLQMNFPEEFARLQQIMAPVAAPPAPSGNAGGVAPSPAPSLGGVPASANLGSVSLPG